MRALENKIRDEFVQQLEAKQLEIDRVTKELKRIQEMFISKSTRA